MSNTVESMRKMKIGETSDRTIKVACDILRTLAVLGGAGWEDELLGGLAALAAAQNNLESIPSHLEEESALNILREKGLIKSKKSKKSDSTGSFIIEDNLYSLEDYTATIQVFGTDKAVMTLRGQ